MKALIALLITLSIGQADSTSQSVKNITSMIKQQLAPKPVKKDKQKQEIVKVNYSKWLTKSYKANN